jgi:hypothetical protein
MRAGAQDDCSWLGNRFWGLGTVVSLQMLVTASLSCCLPRPSALGATDPIPHQRRTGMIPDVCVSHPQVSDSSKPSFLSKGVGS